MRLKVTHSSNHEESKKLFEQKEEFRKKKTVVLDLDDTLVRVVTHKLDRDPDCIINHSEGDHNLEVTLFLNF